MASACCAPDSAAGSGRSADRRHGGRDVFNGGRQIVPERLPAGDRSNRIAFSAECSRSTRATGVKIVYRYKGGKKTEVSADYVVICMPLSVLAGVDVTSHRDDGGGEATTYSNSAKMDCR